MTAQKGISLLLKKSNGDSPETFGTIGGCRTNNITINGSMVEVTNKDHTDRWRRLLAGAGVRSVSASGAGVFEGDTAAKDLITDMFAATEVHDNYQMVVPGLGTFEGAFMITTTAIDGDHDNEVSFNVQIESAGAITFTGS